MVTSVCAFSVWKTSVQVHEKEIQVILLIE